MKRVRGFIASVMAASMMLPCAGCTLRNESRQQFLETSEHYARALASCDLDGIGSISDDEFEEVNAEWRDKLRFVMGKYYEDRNWADSAETIAESITYELYPDTASITNDSGSITCVFTLPDYMSALDREDIIWLDDFYEALFSYDQLRYEVTLTLKQQDGSWLATGYEEVMDELYAFTEQEFSYSTPLRDRVIDGAWFWSDGADGEYYTPCPGIDLDIKLEDGADYSDMYYVIEYQGEEVKREYGSTEGILDPYDENAPVVYYYDDYYGETYTVLAEGEYTITFYDADGEILLSGVAHVY